MRPKRILAITAAIAALSVGTTITIAQPASGGRTTGSVHEGTPDDGPGILSINIDYPGGTVADFLQEVRRVSGYENIVIKDGLDVIKMPPVKLRAVPLYDIIDAVKSMTNGGLRFSANGPVIVCWPDEGMSAHQKAKRSSHVWSLREFIDSGGSADDALAAVELAAAISPGESDLKFHQATGLLFAMGTRDDLEVIDSTLHTLRDSVVSKLEIASAHDAKAQLASMKDALHATQQQLESTVVQLRAERMRAETLQQQIDALEHDRTRRTTELEVRLMMMTEQNTKLKQEIAAFRKELGLDVAPNAN